MQDLFVAVDAALQSGSASETLDMLAREFREMGRYDLLFEARGMSKRLELGLPLVQTELSSSLPDSIRPAYEAALLAAAKEAGELYLEAGNIPAGFRYLRAIGELAPVAAAIGSTDGGEGLEEIISIAFQHGVHPAKGLNLILRNHGMCRAITAFGMHAVEKDRDECLALLVAALHREIVERMRRVIEDREGTAPPTSSIVQMMEGRDWLFGEWDYYVDTSHLTSLIPYCLEVTRVDTLQLLDELCQYGQRLSPQFAFRAQPPFEDGYTDYGHYVKAVLAKDQEEHVQHFYAKAASADPETEGTEAAQLLVNLLSRLNRHSEALDVFLRYLSSEEPAYLRCPNALQLCHAAANYSQMRETARERGDVLSYTAARLMGTGA